MRMFRRFFGALAAFCIFGVLSCSGAGKVYDVVVVGGGTSGTAAAIQSARGGARTLLIEEYEWLGGMLTSAGVSATDGNYKLKGGLWGEFRDSLEAHYGGAGALKTGWVSNILFEPSVGNRIFRNMAACEKNLEVWFRSTASGFVRKGGVWTLDVVRDGKKKKVKARVVVDATELGDVAAAVGVGYDVGMDSRHDTGEEIAPEHANGIIQDLTAAMILKDYGRDVTITRPEGYDPEAFRCCCLNAGCVNPRSDNRLWDPDMMITYGRLPGGKYMINWPIEGNDYYVDMVELSPAARREAFAEAKNFSLCFLYFLQTELGFNHLGLADDEFPTPDRMPFIPYHRESRRIHGEVRFTLDHITEPYSQPQKLYRTSIGVGDYPVDHHHERYPRWEELPNLYFHPVPSYGVPLGVMIPRGVDGLVVAEKSISVSNIVNGSTRLQPVVLQIGQAAGIVATIAALESVEPREVGVRRVQKEILAAGGYLLPYLDIPAADPRFGAMQRIGATGILRGEGMNVGWENQTWFHADSLARTKELYDGAVELAGDLPVAAAELPEFVTASLVAQAAQYFTGRDNEGLLAEIAARWSDLGLDGYDPERALTRLEAAVLVDAFIDPFSRWEVDLTGGVVGLAQEGESQPATTTSSEPAPEEVNSSLAPLLASLPVSVPASAPEIRYVGRVLCQDSDVCFDWSGTCLEFDFTGTGCAMRVSDTGRNYFNVSIDGSAAGVVSTFGSDSVVILAQGLDAGTHRLRLQKRTEGEQGLVTIHSFHLPPAGTIAAPEKVLIKAEAGPGEKPEPTPGESGGESQGESGGTGRHIEFIGDSLTCGYGTEGESADEPFKAETENCDLAFGCIAARYFDADYTLIAHSGRGVARNYGYTEPVSPVTMKDLMKRLFDHGPETAWDFEASPHKPNIVVVNLGSNDFSTRPHPSREDFTAAYAEIISTLRSAYGDVPVLCVAPRVNEPVFGYIRDFCEGLRQTDSNIHFAAILPGTYNGSSDLGSSSHPNHEGQKKMAMVLIPFISSITGWELTERPVL